jgi:predicted MPP superfamily phosphohydrolase
MKPKQLSRRGFLLATVAALPLMAVADSKWLEPTWVKVRRIRLGSERARHRFVHLTDIHHKGDSAYLRSIVRKTNALSPDFVCFTGDLIEEGKFLPEALEILTGIKSPMYGVPGNHDFWSKAPFDGIAKCFAASGGAWLMDEQVVTSNGKLSILGAAWLSPRRPSLKPRAGTTNIFLMHYPAWVEKLVTDKFDVILAGHSHGGQVRLPFYGPLYIPFGVGRYDLGLFQTPSGPLYVGPGLGWYPVPIRFNCRPEITVFEI